MLWAVAIVIVLIGVGLVTLTLVAIRNGQRPQTLEDARVARATSLGMSVGMLLGAALGVIVWNSTGEFVFWVVFVGAGMTVGMAAGHGMAVRGR
jgi:UDP-N-acetylmuramyl pentapeptide phosphotransferase/UDP-N-acetylglucosamine-1-phosphate transferase